MLFNSYEFLLAFLPLVLIGWWVIFRRPQHRLAFLAFASYVFYGWFSFPTGAFLLPLLWVSTGVDYWAGRRIAEEQRPEIRKRLLVLALVVNLGLLGVFKYLGFFTGTLNAMVGLFTAPGLLPVADLILPIGISFYTFNSMSYTIDIYRRRVQPARTFLQYASFVALFPHLIAGPIVRYSDIDTQMRNLHVKLTSRMAAAGIFFFVCGLFKKVVIADNIVPTVDRLFAHSGELTMISGWVAAVGYALQLYFDFSGYSDMAVGLALLLGFRFPQNFNSPYQAINIADFWRRWHMSLSSWLRDYVFIPLGGSRAGKLLTARNLFITMVLGGLWHGAAWVFVLWGIGHGVLLALHSLAQQAGISLGNQRLSRALTFMCVVVLWVPFRAGSVSQAFSIGSAGSVPADAMRVAGEVLGAMFGMNGLGLSSIDWWGAAAGGSVQLVFVMLLAALLVFVNTAPNTWEIKFAPSTRNALAFAAMSVWCIVLLAAPSPFLYFQF